MRDVTLVFLVKKEDGFVTQVLLAMKKRGFGVGRWNGVGGKLEKGESIVAGAKREAKEEIGVTLGELEKVAEIDFYFKPNPEWDQKMHVFLATGWDGEPIESEEMLPEWYFVNKLPFASMWPDDPFWLPQVLSQKKILGRFVFADNDVILEQEVREVLDFSELL